MVLVLPGMVERPANPRTEIESGNKLPEQDVENLNNTSNDDLK